MASLSLARLLEKYPNLNDPNLPHYIGCLDEHDEATAAQAFQRVCFKDVSITILTKETSKYTPAACIWQVHYQLKNKDVDYEDDIRGPEPDYEDDIRGPEPDDEYDSGPDFDYDDVCGPNSSNTRPPKLPKDGELRKFHADVTGMCDTIGVQVLAKYQSMDRLTAIIEYFPKACECECEDRPPEMRTEEPRN